jgi:hypothetical protein
MQVLLHGKAVLNAVRVNNMKYLLFILVCAVVLTACTPSPTAEMDMTSVKKYVTEMTSSEVQVFVESQKDTDGDFNNLQRGLIVAFLLPKTSNLTEITLVNGLVLKRGIRSTSVVVHIVYAKDGHSWKIAKVDLRGTVK